MLTSPERAGIITLLEAPETRGAFGASEAAGCSYPAPRSPAGPLRPPTFGLARAKCADPAAGGMRQSLRLPPDPRTIA